MKISELPKELREKALEYQRNEMGVNHSRCSDSLARAFDWHSTGDGHSFWSRLHAEEYPAKPIQYTKGIDTFERMESNCNKEEILAFCKGNIDKYNWRKKNQDIDDYYKIIDYAKFAIKQLEKNPSI